MDGGMQVRCVLGQKQPLYFPTSQLGCVESGINEDKKHRYLFIHPSIHPFFSKYSGWDIGKFVDAESLEGQLETRTPSV